MMHGGGIVIRGENDTVLELATAGEWYTNNSNTRAYQSVDRPDDLNDVAPRYFSRSSVQSPNPEGSKLAT